MTALETVKLISELIALIAAMVPVFVSIHKISNGMKCQLRSDMLRIYYHGKEYKKIRQYEYENFVMLYESYKALKGNSFIDRIYEEVQEFEIVS